MLQAIGTIKRLQHQAPPLQPVSRREELPLSFAQERLWILHQLEPDAPDYHTATAYRIVGPLNVAALAQSLNEIARRHEILRTTFPSIGGRPVQAIAAALTIENAQSEHSSLLVLDLQDLPESKRETEALRLVAEEIKRPFRLAEGPVLRASLLQLEQEESILLIVSHQIVFDGQAWVVFNRELSVLYEAFSAREPSPLAELPIQYADFAVWQREWLRGEVLEALVAYWNQQLGASFPLLALPTDRPQSTVQTCQSGSQPLALSKTLTKSLKALSQQEGVTLFTTLLAAFKTLLHLYTAQEDILVFTAAVGRNQLEIRRLIGLFSNLLPLRTDFSGNPTFRELLRRVRQVVLGAYAHQDLPFEQMVEALQFERGLNHTSPFQVTFIFKNAPSRPLELSGLSSSPLEVDTGTTKVDLGLLMVDTDQGLTGALTYKTDLFNAATIRRMHEHFQALLQGIIADPDQCLSDLRCLTETDRQQSITKHCAVQTSYSKVNDRPLRTSDHSSPHLERIPIAPRDELEHQLTQIWEEVLDVQPIGVGDDFFDLGGHSLLLARLLARIEKGFDRHVDLRTFLQVPTVEQLANILRESGSLAFQSSGAKIQPVVGKQMKDTLWIGLKNRFLQVIALYGPGGWSTRVWLHRMRGIRIGDDVFIGLGVIIEGAYPGLVWIGDRVFIGVRSVVIGHFGGAGPRTRFSSEYSVRIEDDVYIGPGVVILPSVTIGHGAVVTAGSIVNRSIPPRTMVQGNPAEPVAQCGIPLVGNSYDKFIHSVRPIKDG
jgi:acyl carrier protein